MNTPYLLSTSALCMLIHVCGCFDSPSRPLNIVDFPPDARARNWEPADFFANDRQIALASAVQAGDLTKIEDLVAGGVPIDESGNEQVNALTWAFLTQQKASFKKLLEKGANPNHRIFGDGSLILIAARNGDSQWLEMLLRFKGDPNLVSGEVREVPLVSAIYYAPEEAQKRNIDLLIRAGANLNHQDRLGCTPLIRCMMHNRYDLACHLLEAGTDPRIKDNRGRDLMYDIIVSDFQPGTEGWPWREKLIDMLQAKNVDFRFSEFEVGKDNPEALKRWKRHLQKRQDK